MHTKPVAIECDPDKAASNLRKHGVSFDEAATCLLDPQALAMPDDGADEARWLLVGCSASGRVLTICYTLRGDVPRLISARKATAREKASYAQ
ncbi:MAG: BrnT family toxin [Proteobacteria bacterium]|nr:BrnT family toxin [Pseudomonadota bacterium]